MVYETQQTQTGKDFQAFEFAAATSDETVTLAKTAVEFGFGLAGNAELLKHQGLEAGYKFKAFEEAAGKRELLRLLQHYYPQDLVRYFRNLVAQAKLVEQCNYCSPKIAETLTQYDVEAPDVIPLF